MRILFTDVTALTGESFEPRSGLFVAASGGVIESMGVARPAGDFDREISCKDRLMLPGFVNAHCHVPMTLLRGYAEELPLQRWLEEKIFPAEDRLFPRAVYCGSLLGIAEMLASGVTSFSDMYYFCEDIAKAVLDSGIKANLSRSTVCFDPDFVLSEDVRHGEASALFGKYHGAGDGRVRVDFSLHAEYTTLPRYVTEVGEAARKAGAAIQLHLSETEKEHRDCVARHGLTPAAYFERCGVLDVPVTAAHCVWVTPEDIEILKRHGATAVHCPSSNMKLGSGVAPVTAMLEAGLSVALGTDGAASNNNLNILEELHLAALLQKGANRDPQALPARKALYMATRAGALSQGRPDTGLLEEGMRADLILLDMDKPHLRPCHDPLAAAVYSAQASDVCLTMADGEILYENGRHAKIDLPGLYKELEDCLSRMFS